MKKKLHLVSVSTFTAIASIAAAFIAIPAHQVCAVGVNQTELVTATALPFPEAAPEGIPSIEAFWDSAHHWADVGGKRANKVVTPRPQQPQPAYKAAQYDEIAANVLMFQHKNGGWSKNYHMYAIYNDAEKSAIRANIENVETTFDNETCHCQVAYLAKVYSLSPKPEYREACERGLRFMLDSQLKCGGFPQQWPDPKSFHAFITYNDRVMVGILTVIRDAGNGANGFGWLDAALKERARIAAERGTACILATQYRMKDGTITAWGQQHDPKDLQPAKARAYELPSLCAQDTAEVLEYLMAFEKPTPEIIRSVRAAATWLKTVAIKNTRYENFDSDAAEFGMHSTTKDRRVVPDNNAPDLWARMYELETNRPQFSGRSGEKVFTYAEVDRDRRTGYDWYGFWPAELLAKDHPAWLKKHGLTK